MLGNPDDAKDAEQETFLRTFKALARFNGRYRVGSWITRIATNVCLDQLRARARWRWESMPAELIDLERHGFDERENPESIHIRRAEERRIGRLLNSLSPLHRAAIVLRDFEGLSYEEIGAALEMTDGQVKALLHRARKGFRRSWNSGRLAGLVPLPWLRRVQDGARDHLGQGAPAAQTADFAASMSNLAASCSTTLQQCGQLLTERAAAVVTTVATTVALSTAAVTSVASLPASPEASARTGGVATVAGSSQAGATADAKGILVADAAPATPASTTTTPTSDESTAPEPAAAEPAPPAAAEPPPPGEAPPSEPAPAEPAPSDPPPPSEPPPGDAPPSENSPPAPDDTPLTWEEQPASIDGPSLAEGDAPPADPQPDVAAEQPPDEE